MLQSFANLEERICQRLVKAVRSVPSQALRHVAHRGQDGVVSFTAEIQPRRKPEVKPSAHELLTLQEALDDVSEDFRRFATAAFEIDFLPALPDYFLQGTSPASITIMVCNDFLTDQEQTLEEYCLNRFNYHPEIKSDTALGLVGSYLDGLRSWYHRTTSTPLADCSSYLICLEDTEEEHIIAPDPETAAALSLLRADCCAFLDHIADGHDPEDILAGITVYPYRAAIPLRYDRLIPAVAPSL